MKFLKAIVGDFENYLSATLMTCMVFVLFVQVVARYVFGTGVDWSEELSRYLFIWLVIWAIPYTSKLGGQIRVTIFLKFLPLKVRKIVFLAGEFLWVVFNVLVIYEGYRLVVSTFQFPEVSPTVRVNMAWIYTAVPLGFLFCTVRILQWHFADKGARREEYLKGDMV